MSPSLYVKRGQKKVKLGVIMRENKSTKEKRNERNDCISMNRENVKKKNENE